MLCITLYYNSVGEERWTLGVPLLTALLRLNNFLSEEKMRGFTISRKCIIVSLASFSKNGFYDFVTFQRVESIFEVYLQNNVFRILLVLNEVSKNVLRFQLHDLFGSRTAYHGNQVVGSQSRRSSHISNIFDAGYF